MWPRFSQKLYGPVAEDVQKQPSMSVLSCKDAAKANCLNSLFQHAKYLNSISGLTKCFQRKAQVVYRIRENEPNILLEIKYQLFKPNLHRFEWIKRNFMKRMKN